MVVAVTTEVRIEEMLLETLHNYLGHHRIAWVLEMPSGKVFNANHAAIITAITIERIEE
jgi:hypothetical protein